jgi:hypothetical protein
MAIQSAAVERTATRRLRSMLRIDDSRPWGIRGAHGPVPSGTAARPGSGAQGLGAGTAANRLEMGVSSAEIHEDSGVRPVLAIFRLEFDNKTYLEREQEISAPGRLEKGDWLEIVAD